MIDFINTWAQKIIIVVIICTILEMILPNGKNKKYVKTIMGIYVVFTIISPIISKANSDKKLDLSKYFKTENEATIQTSNPIDTNEYIEAVYMDKIKTDIKNKIEAMNYKVKNINLEIETKNKEEYGTILELELNISYKEEEKQNNIKIEKIVIGNEKQEKNTISNEEKRSIKQYISSVYGITEEKITIY